MKNKIWNQLYKIAKNTYRDWFSRDIKWIDITIRKYKIVKETPKYYFLQLNILSTYCFGTNKVSNRDYWTVRYKKEDVNIEETEDKNFLIEILNKIIEVIDSDDDISNNHKKQYRLSYDLIMEYLKDNDF